MARRHDADGGDGATESKFYHPAATPSARLLDRIERVWATLFKHQVGTSD